MENNMITQAEVNRLEETIRLLREENKKLSKEGYQILRMLNKTKLQLNDAETEIERLKETLAWYADPEKYHLLFNRKFARKMSEADIDKGERARKALENK